METTSLLTDNYILRLKSSAIKKLLEELRSHLDSRASYKGKCHSWDAVLRLKAQELARYLLGRTDSLDFKEPETELDKKSRDELRERISALTSSDDRRMGISKSTLWYLQKRAASNRPLRIHKNTRNLLDTLSGF